MFSYFTKTHLLKASLFATVYAAMIAVALFITKILGETLWVQLTVISIVWIAVFLYFFLRLQIPYKRSMKELYEALDKEDSESDEDDSQNEDDD